MSGFHTYFHWVDEAGEPQRLSDLNSGLRMLEDMVPEREAIALKGDGYPFQYELTVAGLIEVYENAAQYRLRELTLQVPRWMLRPGSQSFGRCGPARSFTPMSGISRSHA